MTKGYRTKINGEYVTGWSCYEVTGMTPVSSFCAGECEKSLSACCEGRRLVPGGRVVCGECIYAYCVKHGLNDPKNEG